jgi:hypothetical protein
MHGEGPEVRERELGNRCDEPGCDGFARPGFCKCWKHGYQVKDRILTDYVSSFPRFEDGRADRGRIPSRMENRRRRP